MNTNIQGDFQICINVPLNANDMLEYKNRFKNMLSMRFDFIKKNEIYKGNFYLVQL